MGHLQVKSHLESEACRRSDIPLTNIIKDTRQPLFTKWRDDSQSLFIHMILKKKKISEEPLCTTNIL